MMTSGSAEVINKPLTRLDVADDKHSDAERPIKIAATLHARTSVRQARVERRGGCRKYYL